MGCCPSKQRSEYHYYEMPRRAIDGPDEPTGRSEFPRHVAEYLISRAPAPTPNNQSGPRPHAHYDIENEFAAERANLRPLEGVPHGDGVRPTLWAYPAEDFDYAGQDPYGNVGGQPPGPHRIITDRDKRIQGMTTHPLSSRSRFVRALERVRVTYR